MTTPIPSTDDRGCCSQYCILQCPRLHGEHQKAGLPQLVDSELHLAVLPLVARADRLADLRPQVVPVGGRLSGMQQLA